MRYTTDERGILNNFAAEPAISYADSPSSKQQLQYVIQGVAAISFLSLLLVTAFAVS